MVSKEMNESPCSLGEGPCCRNEKEDGIKRGSKMGHQEGQRKISGLFFSKNGGILRSTVKLRGRITSARAKVTVLGILSQFCFLISALLPPSACSHLGI